MTENNELLKLNKWKTVPEAAKYLSSSLNEEVTEADIFRFALHGHLKLSVYFTQQAWARCYKHGDELPDLEDQYSVSEDDAESVDYIDPIDRVKEIKGVWDLSMMGGESNVIKNKLQQLTGGSDVNFETDIYILEDENETKLCLLYGRIEENGDCPSKIISNIHGDTWRDIKLVNPREKDLKKSAIPIQKPYLHFTIKNNLSDFTVAQTLPVGSILVVRSQVLIDFQKKMEAGGKIEDSRKPAVATSSSVRLGKRIYDEEDMCRRLNYGKNSISTVRDLMKKAGIKFEYDPEQRNKKFLTLEKMELLTEFKNKMKKK